MARRRPRPPRPRLLPLAVLATLLAGGGCSSGGSGPEEQRGLLQIEATDVDGPAGGVAPAGFRPADITSFRVQINAGPRVVVDSTFIGTAPLTHEFSLTPNTYLVLLEAFQANDVLLFTGAAEATVLPDDTSAVTLDIDPALGTTVATIGGATQATVATNGTADVRVEVRNSRGQPLPGADVDVAVEPAGAGSVALAGEGRTGPDGAVVGVLSPARQEGQGTLRVLVDGFPVPLTATPAFSVVSPVDAGRSTLAFFNSVFVPADGISAAQITARIVDAEGTPQSRIPVTFHSSRNELGEVVDVFRLDRTETDASGQVTATLSSSTSTSLLGNALVTAVADGKELDARGTVSFRSQVSAGNTRISVAPVTIRANGTDVANIVVEVRGNSGQPLPNVFVRLVTNSLGTFVLQPESGRTDANGVFRSRISSTSRVSTFVDVVADGIRTSAVGVVIFN